MVEAFTYLNLLHPLGIPFIFWEQYMTLRSSLALILACALLAALVLVSLLLLSVWAAVLVIVTVLASLAQIFGAMTLLGIKLSAIPAVILILGVGMMLCFNVHISLVGHRAGSSSENSQTHTLHSCRDS